MANARDQVDRTPFSDSQQRDYVERAPRSWTYSQIADGLRETFGPDRAWSRALVMEYWRQRHPLRKGREHQLDRDHEVAVFVEDRAGRMSLDGIMEEIAQTFGRERVPGRSSLGRYIQALLRGERAPKV